MNTIKNIKTDFIQTFEKDYHNPQLAITIDEKGSYRLNYELGINYITCSGCEAHDTKETTINDLIESELFFLNDGLNEIKLENKYSSNAFDDDIETFEKLISFFKKYIQKMQDTKGIKDYRELLEHLNENHYDYNIETDGNLFFYYENGIYQVNPIENTAKWNNNELETIKELLNELETR